MKVEISGKQVNMPDFIIPGAGKSGTTTLHRLLRTHPSIFLPKKKELQFFHLVSTDNAYLKRISKGKPQTLEGYCELFSEAREGQLCGDITPAYLHYPISTISNIKRFHPGADKLKIIVILRNPLQKIMSQYRHQLRLGNEKNSINDALCHESRLNQDTDAPGLFYTSSSLYYNQVKAYMDNFKDVLVCLFDDLDSDSKALFVDICNFLGIEMPSDWQSDLEEKHNVTRKTDGLSLKEKLIKKIINRPDYKAGSGITPSAWLIRNYSLIDTNALDKSSRNYLHDLFIPEIHALEKLIGRDLSAWTASFKHLNSHK